MDCSENLVLASFEMYLLQENEMLLMREMGSLGALRVPKGPKGIRENPRGSKIMEIQNYCCFLNENHWVTN